MKRYKVIKRIIKDLDKKTCRKCSSKMIYHHTKGEHGMEEYLMCISSGCRFSSRIRRAKRLGSKKKIQKLLSWTTNNYDKEHMIFEKTMPKLKDKPYFIGEGKYYNPVTRMKSTSYCWLSIAHEEHLRLVNYIITNA